MHSDTAANCWTKLEVRDTRQKPVETAEYGLVLEICIVSRSRSMSEVDIAPLHFSDSNTLYIDSHRVQHAVALSGCREILLVMSSVSWNPLVIPNGVHELSISSIIVRLQ